MGFSGGGIMAKGAFSFGAALLVAGLADHAYAAPKAALCGSGPGEFGQVVNPSLAGDCGTYQSLEQVVGWLMGAGVVLLGFGMLGLLVQAGILGVGASRSGGSAGRVPGERAARGARNASPAQVARMAQAGRMRRAGRMRQAGRMAQAGRMRGTGRMTQTGGMTQAGGMEGTWGIVLGGRMVQGGRIVQAGWMMHAAPTPPGGPVPMFVPFAMTGQALDPNIDN